MQTAEHINHRFVACFALDIQHLSKEQSGSRNST